MEACLALIHGSEKEMLTLKRYVEKKSYKNRVDTLYLSSEKPGESRSKLKESIGELCNSKIELLLISNKNLKTDLMWICKTAREFIDAPIIIYINNESRKSAEEISKNVKNCSYYLRENPKSILMNIMNDKILAFRSLKEKDLELKRYKNILKIKLSTDNNELVELGSIFTEFIAKSSDVLLTLNIKDEITFITPTVSDLLDFEPREMIGKYLADFIHQKDVQIFNNHIHDVVSKGLGRDGLIIPPVKYRLLDKQKRTIIVESRSRIYQNSENKLTGVIILLRDITYQEKTEQNRILTERLGWLAKFASGLAHELRNPLAVISSCSQFCVENMDLDEDMESNLQMIFRSSQKVNNLIKNLIYFTRSYNAKTYDSTLEEVDINKLIRRMLQKIKKERPQSEVSVSKELSRDIPKIEGDEEDLEKLFYNVLLNAYQASFDEGKIKIKTSFLDNRKSIEILITDDGPGIPEDYQYRIFDPFFTTKEEGVGLGLSICQAIINNHNGSIEIISEDDNGTNVTIRLPVNYEGRIS